MDRVLRTAESSARRAFAASLATLPGSKQLFVEETLWDRRTNSARVLSLFTDTAFLSEHGIRRIQLLSGVKSFSSSSSPSPTAKTSIASSTSDPPTPTSTPSSTPSSAKNSAGTVFLLRAGSAAGARAAVVHIRTNALQLRKCLILILPYTSKVITRVLTSAGLSEVHAVPLRVGFAPIENDLLSLDYPSAHKHVVLDGDAGPLRATAGALARLARDLRLKYSTVRSAGPAAVAVAEELLETHGRKYVRKGGGLGSGTSSLVSSPAISVAVSEATRSSGEESFFDPRAFSLLPPSVAAGTKVLQGNNENESIAVNGHDSTSAANVQSAPARLADIARAKSRNVPLVLIDRAADVVTPLLTQWTYEGILDEAFGLRNNTLSFPLSSLTSAEAKSTFVPSTSMPASSSSDPTTSTTAVAMLRLRADVDPAFGRLRDLPFWSAAHEAGSIASTVAEYYAARPERETAELGAVRSYVAGLRIAKNEHRRAEEHVALAAEASKRTFEKYAFKKRFEMEHELLQGASASTTSRGTVLADDLARKKPLSNVLRLAALWSSTAAGLPSNDFDGLRSEIVAAHGLSVLPLLANLERAGLLARAAIPQNTSQNSALPWPFAAALVGGGTGPLVRDDDTRSVYSMTSTTSTVATRAPPSAPIQNYSWQFARRALRLVSEVDPDEEIIPGEPAAVATPYSGYTPLTVRLIEAGLSKEGWAKLPPVAPHTPLLPPGCATIEHKVGAHVEENEGEQGLDAVVVFVGGVTRAEVSAVRMAARAMKKNLLICTTALLGSDEFVMEFGNDY